MSSIILTGGGSAGHCTPNLALIPYLKKSFDNIYYIGSKNGIERDLISKTDIPYYSINSAKLRRSFNLKNLSIPFNVLSGIKQAEKLIEKLKPDVIFSKGGYVSVPVVIAGKIKKIPIISHESDYSMGLANLITSKFCDKVLTTFKDTVKQTKNALFIGTPIKSADKIYNKNSVKEEFGFLDNKPVLLITGGSQGASTINNAVLNSLNILVKNYNVIHVCGKGNLNSKINKEGYYQCEYLYDMNKAFLITDICVSRAGSNTIFELLNKKIPSLLIPLPKGNSRGDQILNAEYFYKQGLVSLLYQDLLTEKSFINEINALYSNRFNIIRNLSSNPIFDKSKEIADLLASYIRR